MQSCSLKHLVTSGIQFLLAWPLVGGFLMVWWHFFVFAPLEITSVHGVPLILIGDSDWGGSNLYAATVVGNFLFGVLGCVLFAKLQFPSSSPATCRIFVGLLVAGLCANTSMILFARERGLKEVCDYVQLSGLFALTIGFSAWFIWAMGRLKLRPIVVLLCAPIPLLVFGWLGSTGISPKASRQPPDFLASTQAAPAWRHRALMTVHQLCLRCSAAKMPAS
jgi:hypothetical protein